MRFYRPWLGSLESKIGGLGHIIYLVIKNYTMTKLKLQKIWWVVGKRVRFHMENLWVYHNILVVFLWSKNGWVIKNPRIFDSSFFYYKNCDSNSPLRVENFDYHLNCRTTPWRSYVVFPYFLRILFSEVVNVKSVIGMIWKIFRVYFTFLPMSDLH